MNRKIRNIVWYAFLACSALIFMLVFLGKFASLVPLLGFSFFALAATVVLLEAVAHIGWRPALAAFIIVVIISGAAIKFGARQFGWQAWLVSNPPLLFVETLAMWCLTGGFYLVWHRLLPVFDARVVAFLTAIATLFVKWLLYPSEPCLLYLAWLILSYFLARFIPLKGDSKPVSCYKPLTVILIVAVVFFLAGQFSKI